MDGFVTVLEPANCIAAGLMFRRGLDKQARDTVPFTYLHGCAMLLSTAYLQLLRSVNPSFPPHLQPATA